MKIVVISRNGEVKLRVPAKVRDGVLITPGGILLNSDLIPEGERERIIKERKEGKLTKEMIKMGMKIGDNGGGLTCRWLEDVEKEERRKSQAEYDALPLEIRRAREERNNIENLYNQSHKSLTTDTDEDNVSRGYRLQAEADTRLKAWRGKYPKMAMLEDADRLESKALKQESLASGALTYSADGWISPTEQQRRHDEFQAEAARLRSEAQAIREAANT